YSNEVIIIPDNEPVSEETVNHSYELEELGFTEEERYIYKEL
ncbi:26767_t:CDS:1, partial [Dentiscutata erythropus]